jgi:hypothetical protein
VKVKITLKAEAWMEDDRGPELAPFATYELGDFGRGHRAWTRLDVRAEEGGRVADPLAIELLDQAAREQIRELAVVVGVDLRALVDEESVVVDGEAAS